MKKVFAVVVTFNRPDMLKACIEALLKQRKFGLCRVHIVVNSGDSETIDVVRLFLDDEGFLTCALYDNAGPAGGFFYGLKKFLEENCDYVWLMDDDVVVGEYCLRELLQCSQNRDYVFPIVYKGNGDEIVSFGWWGVLISKELVTKAGLPIPELFYWAEDTEYLQNRLMRVHKVAPFRCKDAVVSHLHQRQLKRPSWYYYYVTRNTLYYRSYIVGYTWRRTKRSIFLFPYLIYLILFKEDNKWKKLKLMIYGAYHGIVGKIGKLVDPSSNK